MPTTTFFSACSRFIFALTLLGVSLIANPLQACPAMSAQNANLETSNLPAPDYINTSVISPGTASIEWSAVNGAAGYRVSIYDGSNLIYQSTVGGTQKVVSGLPTGRAYQVKVASIEPGSGSSDYVIIDDMII